MWHVWAKIALKTGPALGSNTENDGRKRKYVCHEENNSMDYSSVDNRSGCHVVGVHFCLLSFTHIAYFLKTTKSKQKIKNLLLTDLLYKKY